MKYSSITKRLVAIIIDYNMMGLIYSLLGLLITKSMFDFFVRATISFLYLPICWYVFEGSTLGNYFLKIRVVTIRGESISFGKSLMRSLLFLISVFLFCISVPLAFLSAKKQALHDRVVETTVIEL